MKRLLPLAITILLVALILWRLDRPALLANLRNIDGAWFLAGIAFFVPQGVVIAWRWKKIIEPLVTMPLGEAARLVFASQSMNLILPSKLGDLTKAVFLYRGGALDLPRATQVVVFEKLLDVAALAFWMLLGLVGFVATGGIATRPATFAPAVATAAGLGVVAITLVAVLYYVPFERIPALARLRTQTERPGIRGKFARMATLGHEVMAVLQKSPGRRWLVQAASLAIWALHLAQIYCFFRALGAQPPMIAFAAFMPLSIFVGLLPFTIAGIGTRDSAMIQLFLGYAPKEVLAGVGLLITLRYLVPAACGLPYLAKYATMAKEAREAGPSGQKAT